MASNNVVLGKFKLFLPKWVPDTLDQILMLKNSAIKLLLHRGYLVNQNDTQYMWKDFTTEYHQKRQLMLQNVSQYSRSYNLSAYQFISGYYQHSVTGRILGIQFLRAPVGKTKVSVDDINAVIVDAIGEDIDNPRVHELLLVVSDPLSPNAASKIKDIAIAIDVIHETQFIADPQEHVLNQRYYKLTEEEKATFFRQESLGPGYLPQFVHDDPIVVANGWKIGDVIRIIRENKWVNSIGKISLTYRYVTQNPLSKNT